MVCHADTYALSDPNSPWLSQHHSFCPNRLTILLAPMKRFSILTGKENNVLYCILEYNCSNTVVFFAEKMKREEA